MSIIQFKNQYIEDFFGYKVYPLEEMTVIKIDGSFYKLSERTEEALEELNQEIENDLAYPLSVVEDEDFTEFTIFD